jgi:hypothetical protein
MFRTLIATTLPLSLDDLCSDIKVVFVGVEIGISTHVKHRETMQMRQNDVQEGAVRY